MIDNLIVGASGFIGRKLASRLEDQVTVEVAHMAVQALIVGDCRRVFFLSAYGNIAGQNDMSEMLGSNIEDLMSVITELVDQVWKCEHFLFTSSSSVLLPVQTPYSRTKRAAEEIILASGIPACIVRPFSITGVGEQRQHLIPTLIRSCMEGEPMNLCLKPVHDFIDVEDVVAALIGLADQRVTGIFHVGRSIGYTNEAVSEIVQEACGKRANITVTEETRPYDSREWVCKFPWPAKKTLVQSVAEMVQAYKKEHAL